LEWWWAYYSDFPMAGQQKTEGTKKARQFARLQLYWFSLNWARAQFG